MATLKQLIEQGIKIGTLVKTYEWPLSLAQYNGKYFAHIGSDGWHLHGDLVLEDETDFEITTAFDTGTNIDELHVPEPVDVTGWVVDSEGYKHQIEHLHAGDVNYSSSFDEETEMQPDYFEFTNGGHAFVYECRPCLPPENNILK